MSRLQQLERVLSDPRNIAEVEAFYADSKDEAEDAEYLSFRGKIVRFDDAIEANASHPSLFGSGFGSLGIVWDQGQNEEPDQVSPWDVSAQDIGHAELLERPKLSEDEKKNVRDALKAIGQLPGVKEFFVFSVDLEKYSDYATRVEVPMDLNFLRSRLEADYYSTRYSVVADVRLIHTNCKKYNGDLDELSDIASDMLETFEGLVLNEEERGIFHKYDMPIAGVHSSSSLSAPLQLNESDVDPAESIVQRRSQRCRSERSLLENLPESAQTVRNVSRQKKSKRASRNRSSVSRLRLPRNDRSVLESRTENIPTLEHLSNVLGSRSRGRTTRSTFPNQRPSPSSAQRNVSDGPVRNAPRRAARAGLRNSTYLEVPSDNDSSERRESALRARRAGRAESRRLTHVENPSINGDTGRAASTRGIRRATLSVDEDPERLELHQSTSKRRPATLRLSSNRSAAVPRSDVPAPGPLSEPPAVITGQRTTRRSSQNLVDPGLAHGSDSREGSRQKRARTTAARSIIDISPTTESTRNSPQLRQSPRRKPLRSCPETDEDNHGSSFESDYALASRRKTTPRLLEETSLEGSNADDNDDNHAATSEESDGYLSVASSDFTSDRKVGRSKRNPSGRSHDASIRKISENDTNMAHDRNATNRIRARHRTTYEDPSSSEFGSDVSVNSSLKTKKSRLKHITKKRKGKHTNEYLRSHTSLL